MKFLLEQPRVLSRRAPYDDESRRNNETTCSPEQSKGRHGNLFLGSTASMFLQQLPTEQGSPWKKIRQMLMWDNGCEVADPQEAREVSIPPEDRHITQVRPDTLKNMYVTRSLGRKYGPTPGCPGCASVGSSQQASHSDTCRDRIRAELEKSEEGREHPAREQARVDAKRKAQSTSPSHQRAMSEEWDRPPEKVLRRVDEEDVTWRQDVTATGGASSSSASGGPAMDIDSQPSRKRAADVHMEDLEGDEKMSRTQVDAK